MDGRILGVDPGTNISGFAVLECKKGQFKLISLGVIRLTKISDPHEKLRHIYQKIEEIIHAFKPEHMAIEAPFYSKNVQSMLKLGRAQGVAIAAGVGNGLTITEYSPKKIKLAVTGNGNASKEQVARMLKYLIKKNLDEYVLDATDALATAFCHYYQNSNNKLTGSEQLNSWEAFIKKNPHKVR